GPRTPAPPWASWPAGPPPTTPQPASPRAPPDRDAPPGPPGPPGRAARAPDRRPGPSRDRARTRGDRARRGSGRASSHPLQRLARPEHLVRPVPPEGVGEQLYPVVVDREAGTPEVDAPAPGAITVGAELEHAPLHPRGSTA